VCVAVDPVAVAEPSPKFQLYDVLELVFADVLVKVHFNPPQDLVKLAVSGGGGAASVPV
jgi:hypothetical protein